MPQRGIGLQPKVAPIIRGYLGCALENGNNANGVAADIACDVPKRIGHNRVAVGELFGR